MPLLVDLFSSLHV